MAIRLNELGMRGPSIHAPVPAEILTLVFLGGSTTENYGYPRELTFPMLVGERLEARLERPVRVFNAGMSAATSGTSLARLQHQVLDLEPSLVIVMHAINDLMSGFHPRYRRDGRHLERPALAGTRPRSYLRDWLRRRSPKSSRSSPRSVSQFPSLTVFERNLLSMAAIAEAHRVPILFLTQAHGYSENPAQEDRERMRIGDRFAGVTSEPPDHPSMARGMRAFNAALLALPASSLSSSFDLAASLPASRELMIDDCHLTRAGNRRVAEVLTPLLEELLESSLARADAKRAQGSGE